MANIPTIIDKRSFFKILRNSFFVCFFLFFIQLLTIFSIYDDNVKEYEKRINTIVTTEGFDLNLMCNVISCSYVKYEDTKFKSIDGILNQTDDNVDIIKYFYVFNKNLDTIIKYEQSYFIISNDNFIRIISYIVIFSSSVIFVIFFIMSLIIYISESKRSIMEKSILKNNLESRLQRDMTESLHHEMGTPIAVIKTLVDEIYRMLYPCKHTSSKHCSHKTRNETFSFCQGCVMYSGKSRAIDVIATKYYEKIMLAIESLNVLQNVIGESKHIKYSNGTVSILEIISNVISSNNSSKVNKIEADIISKEILNKYACGIGLQNGELMLVLNAMVNNSIEAKATKIKIEAILSKTEDSIELMFKDNGRGVRDRDDNLVMDINIFNYGYSTKNKNGEALEPKKLIEKVFEKLFKLNNIDVVTERGVGLSVNKRILNKSGGDIELVETNEKGTLFKITLPIKIRRKK